MNEPMSDPSEVLANIADLIRFAPNATEANRLLAIRKEIKRIWAEQNA